MKIRPEEKDVPHWAMGVVIEMRAKFDLPKKVTDRMIYARLLSPGSQTRIEKQVRHLAVEVR